jgi:hypothetical protein
MYERGWLQRDFLAFAFVLKVAHEKKLLRGKPVAVDATTLDCVRQQVRGKPVASVNALVSVYLLGTQSRFRAASQPASQAWIQGRRHRLSLQGLCGRLTLGVAR